MRRELTIEEIDLIDDALSKFGDVRPRPGRLWGVNRGQREYGVVVRLLDELRGATLCISR